MACQTAARSAGSPSAADLAAGSSRWSWTRARRAARRSTSGQGGSRIGEITVVTQLDLACDCQWVGNDTNRRGEGQCRPVGYGGTTGSLQEKGPKGTTPWPACVCRQWPLSAGCLPCRPVAPPRAAGGLNRLAVAPPVRALISLGARSQAPAQQGLVWHAS